MSWRVSGLEGVVIDLVRASAGAASLAFAVLGDGVEVWRYELPALTLRLRRRTSPDWNPGKPWIALVSESTLLAAVDVQPDGGIQARTFSLQNDGQDLFPLAALDLGTGTVARPVFRHEFLAVPVLGPDRAVVQVLSMGQPRGLGRRFAVGLMGTRAPVVRGQSIDGRPHLVVCDDRGRVLAFALDRQEKLVDRRV